MRSFRPAALLANVVPVVILVIVLVIDPPTAVVLLATGPVLVLLLGLIGRRVGPATAARAADLRWMQGYFADMLQGIATLRAFGRSREQADRIREIGLRYGDSTMTVLRTAFQASLVLEFGAAVAMALVAVELSLRLMGGSIGFASTLAVLIIAPEFFVPLRRFAAAYHEGAAGREAAARILEILDAPRPARPASRRPSAACPSAACPSSPRARSGTSSCTACPSPTRAARNPRSATSTSSCLPAGGRRSSGRRGPASRPSRACCCGSSIRTPAGSPSPARPSPTSTSSLARPDRVCPPVAPPVPRDGRREHPPGPAGGDPRRGRRRGPCRRRDGVHRRPARRPRHAHRRGWRQAERRPAAADRRRARLPARRRPRRPRRAHRPPRSRCRGVRRGGRRPARPRPDGGRDLAPVGPRRRRRRRDRARARAGRALTRAKPR